MKNQTTISPAKREAPRQKGAARAPASGRAPVLPNPGDRESGFDALLTHLINFFTSLKLTVVCLAFGIALVFLGTLAQVDLGLYKAQNEFFRSFIAFWGPPGAGWKIPLPGGYLVGGVLVINLVASHFRRFRFSRDKAGIWMVHLGLILLLLGQLGTDLLSRESGMHLREGDTRNYSETERQAELAVLDATEPDMDKVVAIPQAVLMRNKDVSHRDLPFTVRIKKFYANSVVEDRKPNDTTPPPVTQGIGTRAVVREMPHATEMDRRDVPSAIVEIVSPKGSLGTWLVSEYIDGPQQLNLDNRTYQIVMRPRRYYKPYSITLKEFRHDVYPGTEIPKNFSSRVLLQRADTGESREVVIYMNNPLRYAGETYYQSGFDPDNKGTILQVVHNPSWLTPYFSCILVGLGLVVHFAMHLLGFTFKRRTA